MITQSLTWCLLTQLWTFAVKSVKESCIIRGLMLFFDWITRVVKDSGIYQWLGKDVFTTKYYETSLFYRFAEIIWNFILKIIRKIQLFTRNIFNDSLCLYLFDAITSKKVFSIDVVMAVFLGAMFIVPHDKWNNLYFVIMAVLIGFWVVMQIASGKTKSLGVRKISVTLFAFMVAILVSTVTSLVVSDAIRFALFLIGSLVFAYSIYLVLDSKEKLIRFINVLLLFVAITGIYGIVQRIRGVEINLEFVDIYTNNGMPGRVFSTFSNPNNFAQLLVLFMPFFVPAIVYSKRKTEKLLALAGFCVTFAALLMTYSRSCWVGFALSAILFVFIYDKRFVIPMAILVIAAIPFLPETIMNRIFTIGSMQDTSNSYRIYIWKSCWEMIKDFGTTGLGLGPASFSVMYPGYSSPVAVTAPHSHMLYMQIILEMGILGAIAFFGFIFALTKKAAGSMRKMDSEIRCYTAAAISALFGIAFVCCAEYIWFYPRIMFAFWIVPGLMLALIRNVQPCDK